ncbi:hypothetical protein OTU49_007140 [Cherax quadricarinatus]|uniref:Uncharacterized protein n=1 Tax=Cherax quadricarinatus TaxID=27406 RepID=A0AAW0Y805_CHEQU|nr:uncharacterized protein LOC128684295 [Cherax quadricarinatus]
MEGVPFEVLWCQCQGNSSATPHQLLIHEQVTKMHTEAQQHALWYVGVVLTLYLLGLVVIIRRSGRTERHTAVSALSFCFSRAASSVARRSIRAKRDHRANPPADTRHHNHRQKQKQQQQQQQQQPTPGPSQQLHLVQSKEERETKESSLTTVA